jgi:hypothetical protein
MCPGPDPCVLRRGDCLCCTRPESKTCPESERHLQECEGLFARLRIVGEEEAPGGCHRKTIRRRPSPQQPQNRRLLGTPKHGPHDGLFGLGKERLHPNKRKTGVCWEPRNRGCHRLGDDFVGCLLPPRWGPTTLSQNSRNASLEGPTNRRCGHLCPTSACLGEESRSPSQTKLLTNTTPDILWMSRAEYHILLFYHPSPEPN